MTATVKVIALLILGVFTLQGYAIGVEHTTKRPLKKVENLLREAHVTTSPQEKERIYREVLQLSPDHPKAMFNLALLLQSKKQYNESIQLYEKLLTLNSKDALAHYNLANVLLAARRNTAWQASAWHLRQYLQFNSKITRNSTAITILSKLESNLSTLYGPVRSATYSESELLAILSRIKPADLVRGNSKYDGPRLPLMLNFSPQSATLTPAAKRKLDTLAAVLKLPVLGKDIIRIEGYTDSRELPDFKQRLQVAQQRAQNVLDYLVQAHQLPANRFKLKAFADLEIISTNDTVEGRAANRRVELYNISRGGKIIAPLNQ